MRKLILKISLSLDGFAAGPNGEISWIFNTMDNEIADWTFDTINNTDMHIMGRRTFFDMAAYWPYSDDIFAEPMNRIPKGVFTKKGMDKIVIPGNTTMALKQAGERGIKEGSYIPDKQSDKLHSWQDAEIFNGNLYQDVLNLKNRSGNNILAHGGAGFVSDLIKTGLIDEYRLLIHPVILGKGLPVFSQVNELRMLKLVDLIKFPSGTAAHIYRS